MEKYTNNENLKYRRNEKIIKNMLSKLIDFKAKSKDNIIIEQVSLVRKI